MKLSKILGVVALCTVSLWGLNRALHPKPLDSVALPPYGLGQVLAEAAAQAASDEGSLILICLPNRSVQFQSQMAGFQKGLHQHRKVLLSQVSNLDLNQVDMNSCIPFQKFASLVREHADAKVIVSFLPVSSFTEAQIQQLPQPCPALVVMGLNRPDVRRGLDSGTIKAAVLRRSLDQLPSEDIKTARQWFDYYYELVTN